jgi:hypothetical protein
VQDKISLNRVLRRYNERGPPVQSYESAADLDRSFS